MGAVFMRKLGLLGPLQNCIPTKVFEKQLQWITRFLPLLTEKEGFAASIF
jgi:hypothetical protein